MDKELFEKGLDRRRSTLGAEYVERSLESADDFNRPFQEMVTQYCWGFAWGDESLDAKTRSLINLGILAALGRTPEWSLHFRGAIRNGASRDELRALIHVVSVYCGVPAAVTCFRAANDILAEQEQNQGSEGS